MSTTVISAIALAIPIVLGIIGIALFSAKKKEEEESRSYEEYLKRIEEDPLWELKQRSRKNTPVQRGIPPVQKNLQNPYAAYDAGYDDVMEGDDYDWDRYYRDSEYADGVDDALDEMEEYGRDD